MQESNMGGGLYEHQVNDTFRSEPLCIHLLTFILLQIALEVKDDELLSAFEDMWLLGVHPQPQAAPTAALLRMMEREDLLPQVVEQQPPRQAPALLDALVTAMQKTGHLSSHFKLPLPPPKPPGMTQQRYVQILRECHVEGF